MKKKLKRVVINTVTASTIVIVSTAASAIPVFASGPINIPDNVSTNILADEAVLEDKYIVADESSSEEVIELIKFTKELLKEGRYEEARTLREQNGIVGGLMQGMRDILHA